MPAMLDVPPAKSALEFRRLGDEIADFEQERQKKIKQVANGIAYAIAVPQQLNGLWKRCLEGDAGEVHAARSECFAMIDTDIEFIRTMLLIHPQAARLAGTHLPDSDKLPRALKEAEEFRELLEERWQTFEDIEAMIASEKIALSEDQLRTLAARNAPPAAWFAETAKPF